MRGGARVTYPELRLAMGVIAEETDGSDDSAEAARDCEALAEKDRQTAEKVKRTVLRALHIELGENPSVRSRAEPSST